jgi:hypothetical protein
MCTPDTGHVKATRDHQCCKQLQHKTFNKAKKFQIRFHTSTEEVAGSYLGKIEIVFDEVHVAVSDHSLLPIRRLAHEAIGVNVARTTTTATTRL